MPSSMFAKHTYESLACTSEQEIIPFSPLCVAQRNQLIPYMLIVVVLNSLFQWYLPFGTGTKERDQCGLVLPHVAYNVQNNNNQ